MRETDFYTLRGYNLLENHAISSAMEDYLEMICRLTRQNEPVRVNRLAALLNVKPSSSSKMVGKLKAAGLVDFEPYGAVIPTKAGLEHGAYLLRRHEVLHKLLCAINHSQNELALAEKIEHFFDSQTIYNIETFLAGIS